VTTTWALCERTIGDLHLIIGERVADCLFKFLWQIVEFQDALVVKVTAWNLTLFFAIEFDILTPVTECSA
jgi:hypothetical protein